MNLFIAVIFFCVGQECYFWKDENNFYTKENCEVALKNFGTTLNQQGIMSFGSCLEVNTRNNI